MTIGVFGGIVFETSDKRILNFKDFKRAISSRFAEHDVILRKPKTEFVGPGLDRITFTVNLNGGSGIKPREEMDKWVNMAREGKAYTLTVGTGALGVDKWTVESVSQEWGTIFNQGELYSGNIDVTLKEYVSTIENIMTRRAVQPVVGSMTTRTGTVTATVLNLRNGPSMTAKIIGKLIRGTAVTITKTTGGWYQVNTSLGTGYVASRYIKVG